MVAGGLFIEGSVDEIEPSGAFTVKKEEEIEDTAVDGVPVVEVLVKDATVGELCAGEVEAGVVIGGAGVGIEMEGIWEAADDNIEDEGAEAVDERRGFACWVVHVGGKSVSLLTAIRLGRGRSS